jgi:hypothetical protein
MTDPRRFDEGEATAFERQLFEAAQRQIPSAALKARMRAGLGLAGAPVAVSVAAKSLALFWKLGVFLGLAVLGVVVTVSLVERHRRQTTSAEASPATPEVVSSVSAGGAIDGSVKPTLAASGEANSLMDEIHLLDHARAALSGGAPRRALDVLDLYNQRYSQGRFGPEAVVLRIQALHAAGDTQSARTLGQQFLADYPTNPLAERVARIIRR